MSKLCSNSSFLLFSGDSLRIFQINNDCCAAFEVNCHENISVKPAPANKLMVECATFSPCCNFLAACFEKHLLLYTINSNGYKFISSAALDKTAMSVKFFNEAKSIVVAQRNGCAAFYTFETGVLVKQVTCLGHNSMLTDVLITQNDDFVITSDRDEKIRVSHYPNTFNIQSYCLGHEQFVSSLHFLPGNQDVLLSTSGDGSLRLWSYSEGKQLAIFSDKAPLMKCVCVSSGTKVQVALQKYQSQEISVLAINRENDAFIIEPIHKVSAPALVFDLCVLDLNILFLVDDVNAIRPLDELECKKLQPFLGNVNKNVASLVKHNPSSGFDLLFRREFNNISAYQEKKRARIAEKEKVMITSS